MKKLIDTKYKTQLTHLHEDGIFNNGKEAYKIVKRFLNRFQPRSLLDFGCGHGALLDVIKVKHPHITVKGYDPGNKLFDIFPDGKFEAVISTDVLEHVEPVHLIDTLNELDNAIEKFAFFRIACYPAAKFLPDGRNAHLIVESPEWWRNKILENMSVTIVRERISHVDKTERWPHVKGFNYDVIIAKNDIKQRDWLMMILVKYIYTRI